MKKGIQGFAVAITIASTLVSSLYGVDVRAGEASGEAGSGKKPKLSTEIRPQDDFFGYINAKVLREADIDPKYGFGSFAECSRITDQKLFDLIDEINGRKEHTSQDERMIADYYKQVVSYDASASDADKDLDAVRKEIEGISSIQEYMEILGKYKRLYGISPVLDFDVNSGLLRAEEYGFSFSGIRMIFEKTNKDIADSLEGRTAVREHVRSVLVGLGTEKKEAEKAADKFAALALDIAYKSKDMKFDYGSVAKIDAKEMDELKFDVKSFEKGLQIENPYDFWTVAEKEQFAYITEKLNDEKNLEVFKTWLLVDYVDRYNKFLSDKYKYLKATYGVDTENPDMQAKAKIMSDLPDELGRLYSEKYYSASKDEKVREMCENIKDSYRELIGNADWLTEDGRAKLLNKLENIEFKTGGNYSEKLIETDNLLGKDSYETYKNMQNYRSIPVIQK